ncbi:tyrosine-type recombinase/integrase [Streptomyces tirandamycinicus]|uniref:tyrosine-type recombinase/integrase n=1 Tax=Streptomyces tirandamycinicus TaxID=2174846 RepID=UPI00226E0FC3|nr:site-specific integrase [Streptomyces tirandamycinicus]MCY0984326.1 tyrosine-type recombinase/integrase [Streptomyces tirandamycinicus]
MANRKGKRRRFGSVRKLPSGRFQARYPGPDGLMRSAPETFPSQTDADRWLVRKEAEIIDGRWKNPDDKVLFGVYADSWFKERDYAATTRERNGSALRLHILPTFASVVLSEITTPQIRRWRAGLLESGVGEPTVVKAYQVLRAIMNTAVDDELIQRNPCRIKGAGAAKTAERPFLDVSEVFRLADAVPARFRVLILLAAFTGLRFGELAALQRHDVDLERRTVAVRRALAETRTDGIVVKSPKSAAGVRTVAFPASLTADLAAHLAAFAEPGRTGSVFTGERGGQLRRNNFRRLWLRALKTTGLGDVHFHDLRHTGNTLAATGGATTRELMQRMGHSSVRAALIYQHLVNGRDHVIAAHVDEQIRKVRPAESDEPSGT